MSSPCVQDTIMEDAEGSPTDEEQRTLFDRASASFLANKTLTSHHLDSYNNFIRDGIRCIFEGAPPVTIKATNDKLILSDGMVQYAEVRFGTISLRKPDWTNWTGEALKLLPAEARLRKMTYSASLHADIIVMVHARKVDEDDDFYWGRRKQQDKTFYTKIGEGPGKIFEREEILKKTFLGKIPVMVMSDACHLSSLSARGRVHANHCHLDEGGYFIIKGSEKVLIPQERTSHRVLCTASKKSKELLCTFTSTTKTKPKRMIKTTAKFVFLTGKSKVQEGTPLLTVHFFGLTNAVPAVMLLRALGVAHDKELVERVCEDANDHEMMELLSSSLYAADEEMGLLQALGTGHSPSTIKQLALQCLQKYAHSQLPIQDVINMNLFPHLGDADSRKVMLLGYMLNYLLSCFLGRRPLDNREEFKYKRLELADSLLSKQLRSLVSRFQRELQKKIEKVTGNVDSFMQQLQLHMDGSIITNGLERALSTGIWEGGQTGVAVVLKQNNILEKFCHLRQIRLPVPTVIKYNNKQFYKNMYSMGRVCMVDTPDNENCGVVNALAMACHITVGTSDDAVLEILRVLCPQDMTQTPSAGIKDMAKVFVNGKWVAVHGSPEDLVRQLRILRHQRSEIGNQVEIAVDLKTKEVHIWCDGGRFLRGLAIVDGDGPRMVELIGPEEEETCVIAQDYKEFRSRKDQHAHKSFTHCELDPSFSFSLGTSIIPFFNHNTYQRVMYQARKHGRQAIGIYTTCLMARSDTTSHHIFYPQRPLSETKVAKLLNHMHLSSGQNAIVAVSPFWGYNQEDSIIINRSSIERGLFRTCHFRSFDFEIDASTEKFTKQASSSQDSTFPLSAQHKLDDDGLPCLGENFLPFDVLVRKESREDPAKSMACLRLNAVEKGRVDQVILTSNGDENPIARVRLREVRTPVDGDKFSSRHGQKGVIGLVCPQEDMLFSREGIVPDIIVNPHSFSARQTVGQLAECIAAKIAAVSGKRVEATPFSTTDAYTLLEELHRLGYGDGGKEAMMNGWTGEHLRNHVTLGPVFYQRLNIMAMDKLKYRSKGRVDPFTRQPVAGRQRQGGVKIGEMERDCLIAHGAMANLKERLFLLSDPYTVYVCNSCNILVWREKQGLVCCSCKRRSHIVQVPMPYACKLLYQELFSMGIRLKFWTERC